jgi:hypothetical protein
MKYRSETRTFTIYSEDESLIGARTISIVGHLTNYPQVVAQGTVEASIEIIDQCATLNSIDVPTQTDPETYYYTGSSPPLVFTLNPFVIDPADCGPLIYSCDVVESSNHNVVTNDLCSVNEGATSGTFDSVTGNYRFSSIDMQNFPPGEYTIRITGTEGTLSATYDFTITLVNPCLTATLTLAEPSLFSDQTVYRIHDNI